MLFLAAIAIATALGSAGRAGGWIGATLALVALATVGRIALVLVFPPGNAGALGSVIAAQLPWVTGAMWLLGAGWLALRFARQNRESSPDSQAKA